MIYPKLCSAFPLENHRLLLEYANGEKRVYDFTPNLMHKFYKPLQDAALFARVSVNDGEIEWAAGQDFCPHTLYEKSIPAAM